MQSLPLWECGLKLRVSSCFAFIIVVTPLVGVWIEILLSAYLGTATPPSLPLWECGLKFISGILISPAFPSLPLWECGLKFLQSTQGCLLPGHSPCGSVDWNLQKRLQNLAEIVTPLVGVWIEILIISVNGYAENRHSPCGSVDWNTWTSFSAIDLLVTPLVGVWIEMPDPDLRQLLFRSLPLWECGLKYINVWRVLTSLGHSPCGSVDWNIAKIIKNCSCSVTPLVGVWIEIAMTLRLYP